MIMRSLRSLLAACLALLCACSDSGWNNPYPSSDDSENIFYGSFSERPKHLDPVSSYSENEAVFTGQIYEPILQYHFFDRPYRLEPLTSETVPEPVYYDQDGSYLGSDPLAEDVHEVVYRIKIKPGILFQPHPCFALDEKGNYLYHKLSAQEIESKTKLSHFSSTGTRELVAADYVYQIKRLMHPKLHSPIAGFMTKYIKDLGQFGNRLREASIESSRTLDLRAHEFLGAKIVDKYTYEIRLSKKYPQFKYWLAMSFFAPVPWEADAFFNQPGMKEHNLSLDWYPVGTGPYMLTENNPNRRMVLEKNPNYRGELFPGADESDRESLMPYIDRAHYSLEKESIPGWTKFLQGYYDASGVVSDSFDQTIQFNTRGEASLTEEMKSKGINLVTAVRSSISYMGFNMVDPVVGGTSEQSLLLRRAISIAIDYEELISIFANGRGTAAQGPIPPGIFGYVEGENGINPYVYKWAGNQAKRQKLEVAKDLLFRAGYENGVNINTGEPLTLYFDTVSSGPGSKVMLNWYRKQFSKLGIDLVVRATDYNRFQEKVRKGTVQIFSWGWNADYPDPENFFFLLYGPNAKIISQGENAVNYQNKEFDDLFVRMRSMANGSERQEVINRMLEIVRRDAPWVWGFHPTSYTLSHSWYGNAVPNLMARNTLKYKTIEVSSRSQKRNEWNRPIIWPLLAFTSLIIFALIPAWCVYVARERARLGE